MTEPAAPPPRFLQGFAAAFAWGLVRVVRWRRVVLVGAVTIGLSVLVGWNIRQWGGEEAPKILATVLNQSVLSFALPVVALLLAAEGFAYEVQAQTLVYHLVRPIRRTTLFLARYLAGTIPAALVAAAALIALILSSGVAFTPRAWLTVPAVSVLGMLALAAIYYTLGALFKNGFVIGLIYTFFVEGALSSVPGTLQQYSIMYHVRNLHLWFTDGVLPYVPPDIENQFFSADLVKQLTGVPDPTHAAVSLLVATVVVLVVGAWITARRDFALK